MAATASPHATGQAAIRPATQPVLRTDAASPAAVHATTTASGRSGRGDRGGNNRAERLRWIRHVSSADWPAVTRMLARADAATLINAVDATGRTALMRAASGKRLDIVQTLLAHDNLCHTCTDAEGNTALILAADAGASDIVSALLSCAHDPRQLINQVDINGDSALIAAANNNHLATVTTLLAVPGINPNLINTSGLSALHCAALGNHPDIVRALLREENIELNGKDENGHTPLVLAAANGHLAIVELLQADPRLRHTLQDRWHQLALKLAYAIPATPDASPPGSSHDMHSGHAGTSWLRGRLGSCDWHGLRRIARNLYTGCCPAGNRTATADEIPLITISRRPWPLSLRHPTGVPDS